MTRAGAVLPNVLHHYTCTDHGEPGIRKVGKLLPYPQPILGRNLVWLTNLDTPNAWALGLTNATLCCDRTAVRVTVHTNTDASSHGVKPWWLYARTCHPTLREVLEQTGLPMHWWVSDRPVPTVHIAHTAELWARRSNSSA